MISIHEKFNLYGIFDSNYANVSIEPVEWENCCKIKSVKSFGDFSDKSNLYNAVRIIRTVLYLSNTRLNTIMDVAA